MFRESEAADLGLAGRVALVTGGTRGVGRAVARRLCAAGCHVVLNYANSADQARRTVEELSGLKGSATAVSGAISRPKPLAALLDTVHRDPIPYARSPPGLRPAGSPHPKTSPTWWPCCAPTRPAGSRGR